MNRIKFLFNILFVLFLFIFFIKCDNFILLEYFRIKFSSFDSFLYRKVTVQFVNEFSQSQYCYGTVSNIYSDSESSHLLLYFPRTIRILSQQILIYFLVRKILSSNSKFDARQTITKKFIVICFFGLLINFYTTSLYVNFESSNLVLIFITFSFLKAFLAKKIIEDDFNLTSLFALTIFPFISTGYGFPWFYDFLVYYLLFRMFNKQKKLLNNKFLVLFIFTISLSLLFPMSNSPSLESKIISNQSGINELVDNIDIESNNETYLERKDIRELKKVSHNLNKDEYKNLVINLSKNLKDTSYPQRWKFMVSLLPDFNYHLPSYLWYLSLSILFYDIFKFLNKTNIEILKKQINKIAKILIVYPIISFMAGVSTFLNSFSEYIFFLSRKSELIDFGKVQTWRGINDHYEVFSNFLLFLIVLLLVNSYLNKNKLNLIFLFISVVTLMFSQSRWTITVFVFLIFIISIYFIKFLKFELLITSILIILLLQFIPIFERNEPFFNDYEEAQTKIYLDTDVNKSYWFEPISDKLNRTHAWKNFASGYKPNILSLTFGHGTGSYLNIVKNTIYFPTSGPHSLILQVLNRFGLFGLVLLGYFVLNYFLYLSKGFNRINTVIIFMLLTLFLSLEIKTDSIMLVDGTSVFLFNALNGIIAKLTYEKIKD